MAVRKANPEFSFSPPSCLTGKKVARCLGINYRAVRIRLLNKDVNPLLR